MKILIVSEMSTPYAVGGGEVRYDLLSRQLVAVGHEVTWLSMRQRRSSSDESIDGVRHVHRGPRILQPPRRSLFAKLAFMLSVFAHLARNRYAVVDCQTYAPLPAAWLACRLSRTPIVATIHDTGASNERSKISDQWLSAVDRAIASRVERRLYGLSYTRVLTVSRAVEADLVERFGIDNDTVSVVPNAIDVRHIKTIATHPEPADLIFVGRMVPHKHPEMFLEVAALLNARRMALGQPSLKLKMVGAGPLAASLTATARRLGVDGALSLQGELADHDEVVAHIKSARVLVLPSTREGFGLVLAEAMACATAVAAFRLPAVVETLGPELVDCLSELRDCAGLAEVVAALLDDEELRLLKVAQGERRVRDRFDVGAFAEAVVAVYRRAIGGAAGLIK